MNALTAQKSKSHTRNELKTEIHKFLCLGKVDNSEIHLTQNILKNSKCQSISLFCLPWCLWDSVF